MRIENYIKAEWIYTTNIYEVNLRQYTIEGTINAFIKELPRLKDMGVETLWFMPITPIAKKNKKGILGSYYACSDYLSINPEFGTTADFKNFVKLAHSMGFKIIIDWVANHTGWDHVWTKTNPEYYLTDPETSDFKIAGDMSDIIQLDYENYDLRNAMITAMQYWVTKFDIDGFRCDLAFWITLDFWKQARTELEKIKTLFWLGEFEALDHANYLEVFDAAYTWTWMGEAEIFYKEHLDIKLLEHLLHRYNNTFDNKNIPLWFTSNHDENSWNGTEYEKYGTIAKALTVFSCTWNGTPMIYGGQELPNLKRLQFFEKDTIDWNNNNYELGEFYKTLLTLRKNNNALKAADDNVFTYLLQTTAEKNILSYLRKNKEDAVIVFINLGREKMNFKINDNIVNGDYKNVFDNINIYLNSDTSFEMQPGEFMVFEKVNS